MNVRSLFQGSATQTVGQTASVSSNRTVLTLRETSIQAPQQAGDRLRNVGRGSGAGGGTGGGSGGATPFSAGLEVGSLIGEALAPNPTMSATSSATDAVSRAAQRENSRNVRVGNVFAATHPTTSASHSARSASSTRDATFSNIQAARTAALRDARVPINARPVASLFPGRSDLNRGGEITILQDRPPIGLIEIYQMDHFQVLTNGVETQFIALQYHTDGHDDVERPHIHIRPATLRPGGYNVDDNGSFMNSQGDRGQIRGHYFTDGS